MNTLTIWKYPIQVTPNQVVEMPKGARILCVQVQNGTLCLWALVNPALPKEQKFVAVLGTGYERSEAQIANYTYLGTVQNPPFVWHVFVL